MDESSLRIFYRAAGGVVTDPTGTYVLLLIRPARDEVRLPKGHIEPDESVEAAALREVSEESGYDDLEIIAPLGQQLVAFTMGSYAVQRTEIFYLMQARSRRQILRPQEDEQFFPIWVTWDEAPTHLTFEVEQEWLRRAHHAYLQRHP